MNEENKISYEIDPGIFKKLVEAASNNWLDVKKGDKNRLSFEDGLQKLKDEWEQNPNIKFQMKTKGKEFTIIKFNKSNISFKKASGGTGHTLSLSLIHISEPTRPY